ncbi:MAG: thioredoxin domain-containing protein [Nostocaceae cyanobacterium]|nr:thioredoxin domain-containing protein [Nostocaceae cyanobacterium]
MAVCLIVLSSLPAQAASRTDAELEQQVLQIIRKHPEAILESVQAYQQRQQQQINQTRQAFLQDLKANPQVIIADSPTKGLSTAKITLIEFSDFQCPYCAQAQKTLKNLIAKHPNQVQLIYKHFPLAAIHNQAIPAAKAAWAAQQQGKFWEYHDALFSNQKQLGENLYLDIAKNLNLDLEKFQEDRTIAEKAINKDIAIAEKLQLSGTPFFIIDSEIASGAVQLSEIEEILEGN